MQKTVGNSISMQIVCNSLNETEQAAATLIKEYGNEKIWAFFGEMGAGKTTFIKSLCAALQVKDTVLSPTFSIVNEYALPEDEKIYHFDFYRLKTLAEAYDMGYEEYFYSGHYCFIEWSEKIVSLLPLSYIRIDISVLSESGRRLSAQKITSKQ